MIENSEKGDKRAVMSMGSDPIVCHSVLEKLVLKSCLQIRGKRKMNVIIKELSCGVCLVALPLLFFVGCICSNPRPVSKGVDDSECVRVRMASLLSAMPPKYEADVQDEQERRLCEIAHEFRNGSSAKERVISLEKLDACLGSIRKSGKSVSIDYLMEHLGCVVDSEGEGSCGFRIRDEKTTPCSLIVQWDSNRVIVYSTFVRGYFI